MPAPDHRLLTYPHNRSCSHLLSAYRELFQGRLAETGGKRDVRCISTAGDQHAANTRRVVPRVERVPAIAKVGLKPRSKVHGRVRRRNADVAEIPGAVSRGD